MRVKKIINNNIVVSIDTTGTEVVVMGKGIGFKQKIGSFVNESAIEKVYTSKESVTTNKLTELLSNIKLEHLQVANEIISFAKISLGKKLNENIYLTLTDHIDFAIDRYNKKLPIKNALLWEIKRFYNHEYLIGKEALKIIQRRLDVLLPEDEAGFIALHIVNAELDMTAEVSYATKIMETVQKILDIVKHHYDIDLDEYSLNYERFLTHLKFFTQRLFNGVEMDSNGDSSVLVMLKENYKREYQCVLKIKDYVLKEFSKELKKDEMIYLTIHINRVTEN